jgi:hypothetical protein
MNLIFYFVINKIRLRYIQIYTISLDKYSMLIILKKILKNPPSQGGSERPRILEGIAEASKAIFTLIISGGFFHGR